MASELDLTLILCAFLLQGEVEVRHDYTVSGEQRHIRVDCETDTHVIEVGWTRGARPSTACTRRCLRPM